LIAAHQAKQLKLVPHVASLLGRSRGVERRARIARIQNALVVKVRIRATSISAKARTPSEGKPSRRRNPLFVRAGSSVNKTDDQAAQFFGLLVDHVMAAAWQSREPGVRASLRDFVGVLRHGDSVEKAGSPDQNDRRPISPKQLGLQATRKKVRVKFVRNLRVTLKSVC
jgi:hypothetical protein